MLATVHQPLSHNPALSVLAERLGELDLGLQEELAHCGVLTVRLPCETEIWIGLDQRSRPATSGSSFKVLVVLEPPDVQEICVDGFDLVLTWRQQLLQSTSPARLFLPSAPWLVPSEWSTPEVTIAKRPGLGFLRGSKTRTIGHRLRHDVFAKHAELAERMSIELDFEEGGGADRATRNKQFDNQFVLVIENSRHKNYFSEKLLDAMLSRCVPVYWGCPNVADFFDVDGVIQIVSATDSGADAGCGEPVNHLDDVLQVCEALRPEEFQRRVLTGALERNFTLAAQYAGDFGRRVQGAVEQHLPQLGRASHAQVVHESAACEPPG